MPHSSRLGGTWRTTTQPSVRHGGTWRSAKSAWIRHDGAWRQWWSTYPLLLQLTPGYRSITNVEFQIFGQTFKYVGYRTIFPDRYWIGECVNPLPAYVVMATDYIPESDGPRVAVTIDLDLALADSLFTGSTTFQVRATASGGNLPMDIGIPSVSSHSFGDIKSGTTFSGACTGFVTGSTWYSKTINEDGSIT